MAAKPPTISLPILTLPDPRTDGEGALDPLGLATLADHLADRILPGMTARMIRPRFLTAIAVSAAVREDIDEESEITGSGSTALAFEWLVVEGFVRETLRSPDMASQTVRTPGIEKVRTAVAAGAPVGSRTYLKTPGVFGFHGVYKRLAKHLGIVDDDLTLGESGAALLREWEKDQQLDGFASGATSRSSLGLKASLRDAIIAALKAGHANRSATWSGWAELARHLTPGNLGRREARHLRDLLCKEGDEPASSEVYRLFAAPERAAMLYKGGTDSELHDLFLREESSEYLRRRFAAVKAYESFCMILQEAFHWLLHLSSKAGARAIAAGDFASQPRIGVLSADLRARITAAATALDFVDPILGREFTYVGDRFADVGTAESLYAALLERHANVQKAKPPDGKREWFERGNNDSIFVRPNYRLENSVPPDPYAGWGRPYRLLAVRSFCLDLHEALR